MKITNVVVTKNATKKTENGYYLVEYTMSHNALIRVSVAIKASEDGGNFGSSYIGNIYYEGGNISCNINNTYSVSCYFSDFDDILAEIQSEIVQNFPELKDAQ